VGEGLGESVDSGEGVIVGVTGSSVGDGRAVVAVEHALLRKILKKIKPHKTTWYRNLLVFTATPYH